MFKHRAGGRAGVVCIGQAAQFVQRRAMGRLAAQQFNIGVIGFGDLVFRKQSSRPEQERRRRLALRFTVLVDLAALGMTVSNTGAQAAIGVFYG